MTKNTFITAIIVGVLASIAFIIIQPLFGMATLTSRHASAYVKFGEYQEGIAIVLAWCVHVGVSIAYAWISLVIYSVNRTRIITIAQVLILGWVTTLIATPANEWVVKLVTTGQMVGVDALSPLNTSIGPKLWLHFMFFGLVIIGALVAQGMSNRTGLPEVRQA